MTDDYSIFPPPAAGPPLHIDMRRRADVKRWQGKVFVRVNGDDVTERCVAAHAGEGWALLYETGMGKEVRVDAKGEPVTTFRRGRVTITERTVV